MLFTFLFVCILFHLYVEKILLHLSFFLVFLILISLQIEIFNGNRKATGLSIYAVFEIFGIFGFNSIKPEKMQIYIEK